MDVGQFVIDRPDAGIFRIHRSVMTSPEIYALEQRQIFERCWLYVGHATEVEKPGEFRRRTVAGRPLLLMRGSDDVVRVFYNTCTHRGATVCREDEGVATGFTCFFHAWRFNNKGELVVVPDEEGYCDGFDKGELALKSPRVEQYRGFYFVNFDREAEDLASYLGPVRELMDLTMDAAEALGGWRILRGTAKYSIKANWKLLVENSYDGYHLQPVHATYLDYVSWRQQKNGTEPSADKGTHDSRDAQLVKRTRSFAVRNGQGGMIHRAAGRAIANPSPLWSDDTNEEVRRIRAENIKRFGEARGRQMSEVSRHMVIFPNLAFQDSQTGFRLRQIWPAGIDLIDVLQWDFVPRDERQDLRDSRMESSLAFLGPGGLATPDDSEALEACQRGFGAREVEWSDISRGMHREPQMNDELQMRSFWRAWRARMNGEAPNFTDDKERSGPLAVNLDD
jgi:p-cumate 2,3-dioxygenase alpha subunit